MLLSKYKVFLDEVFVDQTLTSCVESMTFYRKWEDTWFDKIDNKVDDEKLVLQLEKTIFQNKHWRPTHSKTSYFPISDFDVVAVVTFPRITVYNTRMAFQKKINICLDRAYKAFDASHDKLTGLLNASAFNDSTLSLLESITPTEEEELLVDAEPTKGISLSIIALDIDHFKQVNDNFGHVYGDRVLEALGRRLETAAQELKDKSSDKITKILYSFRGC